MTPSELPATVDTGLAIHSLQKQLEESNRQVSRLMAMVEGLTRQLDALLRDRNEEQRAELAIEVGRRSDLDLGLGAGIALWY